jgi:hypothetical protein
MCHAIQRIAQDCEVSSEMLRFAQHDRITLKCVQD